MGNSLPGVSFEGWVRYSGFNVRGKGMKNKRKSKRAAEHREAIRKRLMKSKQPAENDNGYADNYAEYSE